METIDLLNGVIKNLKKAGVIKTKEISDSYHTFQELYHHRAIMFSVIANMNKDKAWKSWLHHDNTMFDIRWGKVVR